MISPDVVNASDITIPPQSERTPPIRFATIIPHPTRITIK